MNVLASSSSEGFNKLPKDAQTVATDFLAIYTAELDRFVMTGLKKILNIFK